MRHVILILILLVLGGCGAGGRDPVVLGVKPEARGTGEYCMRNDDYDPRWIEANCGICHWIG